MYDDSYAQFNLIHVSLQWIMNFIMPIWWLGVSWIILVLLNLQSWRVLVLIIWVNFYWYVLYIWIYISILALWFEHLVELYVKLNYQLWSDFIRDILFWFCLIYWLLLRSKLILKIGSTYVTRTQIEVSDTGMCLSVGLIKLRILRHLDTDIRCPIFGHEHLDIAIKYDSFFWIFYVCVIIYYYMQC